MAYPKKLPPTTYRRIIEELSAVVTDPAIKLKFIEHAIDEYDHLPLTYKSYSPLAEMAYRKRLLELAERFWPGSQENARHLAATGNISTPRPAVKRLYRFRHVVATLLLLVIVCGLGVAAAAVWGTATVFLGLKEKQNRDWKRGVIRKSIVYPEIPAAVARVPVSATIQALHPLREPPPAANAAAEFAPYLTRPVWLVEKTAAAELYSNSLQIFTGYTVANVARRYRPIFRHAETAIASNQDVGRIAGILFHTSESDLVPFRPEMNMSIKQKSKRLIKYLQRRRSYNYIIDRYGRVYRLVQEDHAAYHAGNSIWSDGEQFYLDLNHAFLGICFEAQDFEETETGTYLDSWNPKTNVPRMRPRDESSLTEAQLRSGKELTDWLRVKYKIPQHNCVPHGLVSVNPQKKLIGYHLDLSQGFPFAKFSLSNKYNEPLPSMVDFGFSYDDYFEQIFGGQIWPGIRASEAILQSRCQHANISLGRYKRGLNDKYDAYGEDRTQNQKKSSAPATAQQ